MQEAAAGRDAEESGRREPPADGEGGAGVPEEHVYDEFDVTKLPNYENFRPAELHDLNARQLSTGDGYICVVQLSNTAAEATELGRAEDHDDHEQYLSPKPQDTYFDVQN